MACATGIVKMTGTSHAYRARHSSRCHPNILLMAEVHSVKLIDSEHPTNETERLSQISATQQVQLQRCTSVAQAVCEQSQAFRVVDFPLTEYHSESKRTCLLNDDDTISDGIYT